MKIGFYGGKFLPLHVGHISCIIEASNQCDVLYVGLSHSKNRDKLLCNIFNFKYIPSRKRLQWLDQIASDLPNVKIIDFEDLDGINYNSWEEGAKKVSDKVNGKIDVVFGSEKEYKEIFEKIYPNSKYIYLGRDRIDISSTKIRKEGVFKNWEFIPTICKSYYNKKVVIVGTESVGKSSMTKKLAMYYNTAYVSEYGRTMCDKLNTGQPTKEYYPYIAYGHKMEEFNKNEIANKLLFIDTESITTQFYSKLYANTKYKVLNEISKLNDYDLWIYLEPDIKWVDDGLRIHGSSTDRQSNNNVLKEMLISNDIKYICISGSYTERFNSCIGLIDDIIK